MRLVSQKNAFGRARRGGEDGHSGCRGRAREGASLRESYAFWTLRLGSDILNSFNSIQLYIIYSYVRRHLRSYAYDSHYFPLKSFKAKLLIRQNAGKLWLKTSFHFRPRGTWPMFLLLWATALAEPVGMGAARGGGLRCDWKSWPGLGIGPFPFFCQGHHVKP